MINQMIKYVTSFFEDPNNKVWDIEVEVKKFSYYELIKILNRHYEVERYLIGHLDTKMTSNPYHMDINQLRELVILIVNTEILCKKLNKEEIKW
jgi:hypothetical protein